jgi:hypothetical protein
MYHPMDPLVSRKTTPHAFRKRITPADHKKITAARLLITFCTQYHTLPVALHDVWALQHDFAHFAGREELTRFLIHSGKGKKSQYREIMTNDLPLRR